MSDEEPDDGHDPRCPWRPGGTGLGMLDHAQLPTPNIATCPKCGGEFYEREDGDIVMWAPPEN